VAAACVLLAKPCVGTSRCHGSHRLAIVVLVSPLNSPTRRVIICIRFSVVLLPFVVVSMPFPRDHYSTAAIRALPRPSGPISAPHGTLPLSLTVRMLPLI